jgi:TRAP-type uncharacterized transport system substrate-binding protein
VLLFAAAAAGLYHALRPVTLRIAVGPPGSDDQKLIETMAETFDRDRNPVRLSPIVTEAATQSLALLRGSKAELAVARGDLDMPGDAEAVVLLRKNVVVLWSPAGLPPTASKKQPKSKIKTIEDLEGHRVGVIGKTSANVTLLRLILTESGVAPDKVAVTQFGTDQIQELARDTTLDAFMSVGPVDSKITADAIAATARTRGEPKFLPIDVSEAIALKHPLYESEEIPGSVFNVKPAWPDDKLETVSVSHLIVAQNPYLKPRSPRSLNKCLPTATYWPERDQAAHTSRSRTPTRTPRCRSIAERLPTSMAPNAPSWNGTAITSGSPFCFSRLSVRPAPGCANFSSATSERKSRNCVMESWA